ncbi:MAG: peroxiredoxin-like family protein [Cyclonatronaceae bacterium]
MKKLPLQMILVVLLIIAAATNGAAGVNDAAGLHDDSGLHEASGVSVGSPGVSNDAFYMPDGHTGDSGGRLPTDAAAVHPLIIGTDMPEVTLRTISGEPAALREMYPDTPVMVIFYRGGWCPFCSRHLAELATMVEDIHELGLEIVAVSPDSPDQLRESLGGHDTDYTLLSDADRTAARRFGIAFQVTDPERVSELADRTGHTTTPEGNYIFPVPAVFILDSDKVIRFQYVDPDYTRRISGDLLMAAAEYVSGL